MRLGIAGEADESQFVIGGGWGVGQRGRKRKPIRERSLERFGFDPPERLRGVPLFGVGWGGVQ